MQESTKLKIEEIKANPLKTVIILDNEPLDDEAIKLLVEALAGRQLTRLAVYGCGISPSGMELLKPIIQSSPDLTFINFGKHNIDLTLFNNLRNLTMLYLEECNIDAVKMLGLKEIIQNNSKLDELHLSKNNLCGVDLSALESKAWAKLNLENCTLTLNAIRKFFPTSQLISSLQVAGNIFSLEAFQIAFEQYKQVAHNAEQHGINLAIQETLIVLKEQIKNLTTEFSAFKAQIKQETDALRSELASANARIKNGQQFFDELLINGAINGNVNIIDTMVKAGANLDTFDEKSGDSLLSLSLQNDHYETSEFIINKKPTLILKPNKNGKTPLEQTAENDDYISETEWLLTEAKKYPDLHIEDQYSKLYQIAGSETKRLLAVNKLWESVKTGNLAGLKDVLHDNELNIDINAIRHKIESETLLYQAVYYLHEDISRYLLEKGADVKIASHVKAQSTENEKEKTQTNQEEKSPNKKFGETAYEVALGQPNKKLVPLLTSHLLLDACKRNDISDISKALSDAKDVLGDASTILEEKNTQCDTALHLIATSGNADCMALLLNAFENNPSILEAKDAAGRTALHAAVEYQNIKIVELLLNKKASVAAIDDFGQIPLHKVIVSENKEIMNLLLQEHAKNDAPINIRDKSGKTPHAIANAKSEELAEDLYLMFGEYRAMYRTNKGIQTSTFTFSTDQTLFKGSTSVSTTPCNNVEYDKEKTKTLS